MENYTKGKNKAIHEELSLGQFAIALYQKAHKIYTEELKSSDLPSGSRL